MRNKICDLRKIIYILIKYFIVVLIVMLIYYMFGVKNISKTYTIGEIIEPHIDNLTGVKYITYEDFGAKSDENFDNYNVIKNAHEYANINGYEVRATSLIYHIYKLNELPPIIIKTNTNWNNATFIIHDEEIKEKDSRNYAIFQISQDNNDIIIEDKKILKDIILNKNTKQINQLTGYGESLCIAYNYNKIQFIRSGSDKNNGNFQIDIFKIDNEGNILNDIQWDFDNISKIIIKPISKKTLIVENGNFETKLSEIDYEQNSGYFNRNIVCNRNNTVIKDVIHTVNNNNFIGGPYHGFIKLNYVSDVKLKNCELYSHKYSQKSNYDLIIEYSANIEVDNIDSNDIMDKTRWGIIGTNYTKDITYKNCRLNRIDAHCGVHNLNINNCVIGIHGITVVGSGELNINNITNYGKDGFVHLRNDYGSTWNGVINIENCTYVSEKDIPIINFFVTYDRGQLHNYGYPLYLPNIVIDNLIINDENIDKSNEEIYIFNNTTQRTGVVNGDLRNNYILPKNVIIKSYKTASERNLKLFYNEFYNDINELKINFVNCDLIYNQISSKFNISKESNEFTITGINLVKNKIKNLIQELDFDENYIVSFYKNNEIMNLEDILTTGIIMRVYDKEKNLYENYTIIIYGDTSGDGEINSLDALSIVNNKINNNWEKVDTNDIYIEAGRVSNKTRKEKLIPSSVDALAIIKSKLGKYNINQ